MKKLLIALMLLMVVGTVSAYTTHIKGDDGSYITVSIEKQSFLDKVKDFFNLQSIIITPNSPKVGDVVKVDVGVNVPCVNYPSGKLTVYITNPSGSKTTYTDPVTEIATCQTHPFTTSFTATKAGDYIIEYKLVDGVTGAVQLAYEKVTTRVQESVVTCTASYYDAWVDLWTDADTCTQKQQRTFHNIANNPPKCTETLTIDYREVKLSSCEPKQFCGNGVCESSVGETSSSCSADCGGTQKITCFTCKADGTSTSQQVVGSSCPSGTVNSAAQCSQQIDPSNEPLLKEYATASYKVTKSTKQQGGLPTPFGYIGGTKAFYNHLDITFYLENVGTDMPSEWIFEVQQTNNGPSGINSIFGFVDKQDTCDSNYPENVHRAFRLNNGEKAELKFSIDVLDKDITPEGTSFIYPIITESCGSENYKLPYLDGKSDVNYTNIDTGVTSPEVINGFLPPYNSGGSTVASKSLSMTFSDWKESSTATRLKTLCSTKDDCQPYTDTETGDSLEVSCVGNSQVLSILDNDVERFCSDKKNTGLYALGGGAGGAAAGCTAGAVIGVAFGGVSAVPGCVIGALGGGAIGAGSGATYAYVGNTLQINCAVKKVPPEAGACIAKSSGDFCSWAPDFGFGQCGSAGLIIIVLLVVLAVIFRPQQGGK